MGRKRGESRGPYAKNPGRRVEQHREMVDERRETTARLTRARWSANRIAEYLGVDQRTVRRYRRENRMAADHQAAQGQHGDRLAS